MGASAFYARRLKVGEMARVRKKTADILRNRRRFKNNVRLMTRKK